MNNKIKIYNIKGQITIWVIVAMMIVASMIILAYFKGEVIIESFTGKQIQPQPFIEECTSDAVKETIEVMLSQGGFVVPTNYKIHDDIKVSYLCYSSMIFDSCVSEHPALVSEMEEELKISIESRVDNCFSQLKQNIEKKGGSALVGFGMELSVSFVPDRIEIGIKRDLVIEDGGENRGFNEVQVSVPSSAFELASIAESISNDEAEYCEFNHISYMTLNPGFDIMKSVMSDGTEIYSIKDEKRREQMNVAIRGCINN